MIMPKSKEVFPQDLITISLWGGMEEVGVSPVRGVLGLSMAQWQSSPRVFYC